MENQKLKIKLDDNKYLVVENYNDIGNEFVIYLEKDRYPLQDLALVRESYDIEEETRNPGKYEILVWTNEYDENYTHKFEVNEYHEKD